MTCKQCGLEKRRNIKFFNMGGGWSAADTSRNVDSRGRLTERGGDYEEVAFIPFGLPSYTEGSIEWRIPKHRLDPSSRRKITRFLERLQRRMGR